MIRAHLASFPPRRALMLDTVRRLAPQVDRLVVCLNEYSHIPAELADHPNVEPLIPDTDLKDAGKFAAAPAPDDIVLTVDDDIAFPDDYVVTLRAQADRIGLDKAVIGFQANAWVYKKGPAAMGWRNFMFFKAAKHTVCVDVLGTGTAMMLGKNVPPLKDMQTAAGFVDVRFALWQRGQGNTMWTVPRADEYLQRMLPDDLQDSSLFNTVTRNPPQQMQAEITELIAGCGETSGKRWDKVA